MRDSESMPGQRLQSGMLHSVILVIYLHALPQGIAIGANDHGPSDRPIVCHLSIPHHV